MKSAGEPDRRRDGEAAPVPGKARMPGMGAKVAALNASATSGLVSGPNDKCEEEQDHG
jgi:hypothetical protein